MSYMDKFGLIGHPIKGSLSPALFKAAYGNRYGYDLIEGSDFEKSYEIFVRNYKGVNITAPFKKMAFEKVIEKGGTVDPICKKIGATNLLVKTESGIAAYNSDYIGIIRSLLESLHGSRLENKSGSRLGTALIVGCGGAGKAAAVAAADLGFRTILMNRTIEKAEAIAISLPEYGFSVMPLDQNRFCKCFRQCDLIIYTLPESIPYINELVPEDYGNRGGIRKYNKTTDSTYRVWQTKVILEANYKTPSFDAMTIKRANPSAIYIPGTEWLLYQAAGGYRLFTGEEPDLNEMVRVEKFFHSY